MPDLSNNFNNYMGNLTAYLVNAINYSQVMRVKALLDLLNEKDFIIRSNNFTLLHLAVMQPNSEIVKLFAEANLLDKQDIFGETAMHKAIKYNYPEHVQVLLSAGASVDIANTTGCTALSLAVRFNQLDITTSILKSVQYIAEANIDAAIATANKWHHSDIAKILREYTLFKDIAMAIVLATETPQQTEKIDNSVELLSVTEEHDIYCLTGKV